MKQSKTRVRFSPVLLVLSCTLPLTATGQALPQDAVKDALTSHRYPDALALSETELQAHPGNARIWTYKAIAQNGLGNPHEALLSIQHALQVQPDDLTAAQAGAQIAYRAHDLMAESLLATVLRLEPANATAHAMAGVLALEKHACAAAANHFAQAGSLPEMDSTTSLRLAACQAESGDQAGAAIRFESLHRADPGNLSIVFDLASVYVDGRRYQEAIVLLKTAQVTGRPLDADMLSLLGGAYAGNDQVTEAIETYRTASALYPHDPRPYIDLAILSMDHQSPAVALGVLDAAIRTNPKSAALYTMRGSIYAQIAKNEAAQTDFETADKLSPSEMSGTIGLGVLLRDESNLDQAQQVLQTKLNGNPGDPVLSYMLADVLIRKGAVPGDTGFTTAERLLKASIAKQPDLAQAHSALGKMELKAGRNDEAIIQLEVATKLEPRDRTALNQLVAAYRRTGRSADADRVAEHLAQAVSEERAQETEKNRVHLMIDAPVAVTNMAAPSAARE